jgi:hypothetical protein
MTRNEVCLWLSDRVGEVVDVSLEVETGDPPYGVLSMRGVLAHWTESAGEAVEEAVRRALTSELLTDDLAAWYRIGDQSLDLTKVLDSGAEAHVGDDELVMQLDASIFIRVRLVP